MGALSKRPPISAGAHFLYCCHWSLVCRSWIPHPIWRYDVLTTWPFSPVWFPGKLPLSDPRAQPKTGSSDDGNKNPLPVTAQRERYLISIFGTGCHKSAQMCVPHVPSRSYPISKGHIAPIQKSRHGPGKILSDHGRPAVHRLCIHTDDRRNFFDERFPP